MRRDPTSVKSSPAEGNESVARCRHHLQFNSSRTPHKKHRFAWPPPFNKFVSDCYPRKKMTRCAPASDDDPAPRSVNGTNFFRFHFDCRAILRSNPAAAAFTINEVPPDETKGSVTPVIGSRPTTPPRFTKICRKNHTDMPAASSDPKTSGAICAVRNPVRTSRRSGVWKFR